MGRQLGAQSARALLVSVAFGPGEIFSLACALIWAIAVILFKKSGESLEPFALNLVKNAIVLPLFVLCVLLFSPQGWPEIPPLDLALIFISGFFGIAVGDTLYFRALNAMGAGRMAVVQTLYSPFVILLSLGFLGEQLNVLQFGGVLLVLLGIWFVSRSNHAAEVSAQALWRGIAWGALAVFFMAVGVVMAKPLMERQEFFWVVGLRVVGGFGGMLIFAAAGRKFGELGKAYRKVRQWPVIVAAGITGTWLSTLFWLAGYKYTQASIAAVLNETAAIFILVLSVLVLRERVTARQWWGTLLAVAGVLLVVVR